MGYCTHTRCTPLLSCPKRKKYQMIPSSPNPVCILFNFAPCLSSLSFFWGDGKGGASGGAQTTRCCSFCITHPERQGEGARGVRNRYPVARLFFLPPFRCFPVADTSSNATPQNPKKKKCEISKSRSHDSPPPPPPHLWEAGAQSGGGRGQGYAQYARVTSGLLRWPLWLRRGRGALWAPLPARCVQFNEL